jgi:preprotein translocase subunit SecD
MDLVGCLPDREIHGWLDIRRGSRTDGGPVSCTNQATLDRCIERLPTDSEIVLQIPFGKFVLGPVIVDASNLISATAVPDPNGTDWGVKLQFDAEGTTRLAAATAVSTSEPSPMNEIANIIEGHIISSRVPQGKTTDGQWFVFSDLYEGKAEQLAARLNAGVLPTSGASPSYGHSP